MKRILALLTALALACIRTVCVGPGAQCDPEQSQSTPSASSAPVENAPTGDGKSNILVAYFSATGNTEGIARHIQTVLDTELAASAAVWMSFKHDRTPGQLMRQVMQIFGHRAGLQ